MSTVLLDFFTDLHIDPARHRDFREAPADAMTKAGLSLTEQQAVLGGDADAVRGLLDPEFPETAIVSVNASAFSVSVETE
jgi:hypothetical protein